MKQKFREWLSIRVAKQPRRIVLMGILLFNIVFIIVSAFIIRGLSLSGTEQMGFLEAVFCTITMILDAGCVQFVIEDIGQAGLAIAIICLLIIFVGMVSFTGAVIGYVTNTIANFIDNANTGGRRLYISNHVVILNWNTRASEIINDLLYCKQDMKVVVLVDSRRNEIEKTIEERLSDTISRENAEILKRYSELGYFAKKRKFNREKLKNNVTVIVREGDIFSSKQLHDIAIEHAKSVIILGNDMINSTCKFEAREYVDDKSKGNSQTVKTLMQVADITSADYSDNDQKIIVEITDNWTAELVDKIIECKQVDGKCNIVPVNVNKVLGQLLSQFSLMPELNLAYKELFSNKGASFFAKECEMEDDSVYIERVINTNAHAIPLTIMQSKDKIHAFYASINERDIDREDTISDESYRVKINKDYWIAKKNVIILGHNSKCDDIMKGFDAFRTEWNYADEGEILDIVVVDDKKNLEKMDYYKAYPFVKETVAANIYDKDLICKTIDDFVAKNDEDTSILILSDDMATNDNIDANALANLVYVQDMINRKKQENPDFDEESIDVIVEIIDPKHHDIVSSYCVNNVVISNRYISKMITQIGEKEAIFDFYTDILTYDTDISNGFESKEIYAKKVSRLFDEVPGECSAAEFVRAVYYASISDDLPKIKQNPTIVLGYVKAGGKMVLFEGNLNKMRVNIDINDKLIVFSNH